ncbi:MAG: DUF1573 domain-containing protein [Bacteroidales bacterium]|nr:DUF1573 domain-containing protein [Bacteroidales bacterium]
MKRVLLLFCLLISLPLGAWERLCEGVSIDRKIYEFGDIQLSEGPKECVFTLRNDGKKDWIINQVTTSCGCTQASWTKGVVKPGAQAAIKVTYKNDDGPYPFDKSLTLSVSASDKPFYLSIRGVCHDKPVPLSELYPIALGGGLAVKDREIKGGTLEQGGLRSECFLVANTSGKDLQLDFADAPAPLRFQGLPLLVPAGKTARVDFTVSADEALWGKNWYSFSPVVDGKKMKSTISIWAITQMNASSFTREQKHEGALPRFQGSSYSFGKKKTGDTFEVSFSFRNAGQADLCLYKFDLDKGVSDCRVVLSSGKKLAIGNPSALSSATKGGEVTVIRPGESATLTARINTKNLPKGEQLLMIRLITNSPMRPMVDLFAAGWVE